MTSIRFAEGSRPAREELNPALEPRYPRHSSSGRQRSSARLVYRTGEVTLTPQSPDRSSRSRALVLSSLFSLLCAGLVACQQPLFHATSESERLRDWFETQYEQELQQSPMALTRFGLRDRYGEIDDFSEVGEERRLQRRARSVEELRTSFDYDTLDDEAKVSYDIWVYQYEASRRLAPFRRNAYVFTQMNGVHAHLPNFLINLHRVEDEGDMRAYISRIGGISRALGQLLERAKLGAVDGVRPPRFAHEAVIAESKKLLTGRPFTGVGQQAAKGDVDSPIWADAQSKIAALLAAQEIDAATADELRGAAEDALLQFLEPAYSRLIAWTESDLPLADAEARGVGSQQDGKAYYDARLADATTTSLSAEEIHDIGLREVERIRAEMDALKQRVGFEGRLSDFFEFVKSDPRFLYPNDDAGRQAYLDDSTALLARIHEQLPEFFGRLPRAKLIVKRVESFQRTGRCATALHPWDAGWNASGCLLRTSLGYERDAEERDGGRRLSRRQPGPSPANLDRAGAERPADVSNARLLYGLRRRLGVVRRVPRQGNGRLPKRLCRFRTNADRNVARDSARRRHRNPLEGLERRTGRCVLHGKLGALGPPDSRRSSALLRVARPGDFLQDRDAPDPRDAREGRGGVRRTGSTSAASTTRSSAEAPSPSRSSNDACKTGSTTCSPSPSTSRGRPPPATQRNEYLAPLGRGIFWSSGRVQSRSSRVLEPSAYSQISWSPSR